MMNDRSTITEGIEISEGDNQVFIGHVRKIIDTKLAQWAPHDVWVTRIDNWFDEKWMKFSGTIMHELSVWKSEVTVPPFHPNRVVVSQAYVKNDAGYSNRKPSNDLHIFQESTSNLKRLISKFSTNGLFLWFSGNSEANDKGSLMGYLVTDEECVTFFIMLDGQKGWHSIKTIGLTAREVDAVLDKPVAL